MTNNTNVNLTVQFALMVGCGVGHVIISCINSSIIGYVARNTYSFKLLQVSMPKYFEPRVLHEK